MGEVRNAYEILIAKYEEKTRLEK